MSTTEEADIAPINDDGEPTSDPEIDVAALMGFGSFGSKPHLKKKRRLNESEGNAGTGANSVVLPMNGRKRGTMRDESLGDGPLPAKPIGQADGGGSSAPLSQPREAVSSEIDASTSYATAEAQASVRERAKLPNGEWDWYALRRGVPDENGDMAYFDKSFVEDPWARLKTEDGST